ncbi:hypothetical protein GCM10027269_21530 [Kribbella endophytica]
MSCDRALVLEVAYFRYDGAVTKHVVEQLTDHGMVHVTTVTRFQPGSHMSSLEAQI